MRRALLLALVAAGCGQDAIGVAPAGVEDYGRAALDAAVGRHVAAGRTAEAFVGLVDEVRALRPRMDEVVAAEAERKLLVMALEPASAMATRPPEERAAALATTVWAFALTPSLISRSPDGKFDARGAELRPAPSETPAAYLLRLCGGPLAQACKHAVPEFHAVLVEAVAVRRLTERVRNAVSACYACATEPAWARAVAGWEALERDAAARAPAAARRAAPDQWPVAGAAAAEVPVGKTVTLRADGALLLGDVALPTVGTMTELARRAGGEAVALHAPPTTPWAQIDVLARGAAAAGVELLVDARVAAYPWPIRRYRLPRTPVKARGSDPLQVVLRTLDHAATPRER